MKYTDDEIAEAALLLASLPRDEVEAELPADLQQEILARAVVVATEVRFSTTKAGVVALDAAPARRTRSTHPAVAWAGWIAAAACVALGVYRWRSDAVERDRAASASLAAPLILAGEGGASFEVTSAPSRPGVARVVVRGVGASLSIEGWTLWLGDDDARSTALGVLTCRERCEGRTFELPDPDNLSTHARQGWLTRASDVPGPAVTVARGARQP